MRKGWIYFMALHRGMHRYQCESVIDAPGFPRSTRVQTQPREAYQPSERKTWLKQERWAASRESAGKACALLQKKRGGQEEDGRHAHK